MDVEMSGVTAWSFFSYRHPQGVLPPDCIPSIVSLFLSDHSTFISGRTAILKIPNI